MSTKRQINLHLVLTIFLGIGMVVFGVLAIIAWRDNQDIHNNLDQKVAAATAIAVEKQKKEDKAAFDKANELPYRTYTADSVDGGFSLDVPKNWSIFSGHNNGPNRQLQLIAGPNAVKVNYAPNANNTLPFQVQLVDKSISSVNREWQDRIKTYKQRKKVLVNSSVSVSGITASKYEGIIDDKNHNGIVVTLPVRDKTMIISTDSVQYKEQFNAMLSSAKITP